MIITCCLIVVSDDRAEVPQSSVLSSLEADEFVPQSFTSSRTNRATLLLPTSVGTTGEELGTHESVIFGISKDTSSEKNRISISHSSDTLGGKHCGFFE